ncbi:MAG: YceH family protein [Planctomycetes bacterium]|nr:YceH family protein [Planctomycetota bacterium]
MAVRLDVVELRVLGVLIEKSFTQPDSYPLTLNAILLGANQKQNRNPVLSLSEAEVGTALHQLEQKELVTYASSAPGARANRFAHQAVERFHWDRREQAVMAELMLRGRQTAGELRTRASRMMPIPDLEAVAAILQSLTSAEPPYVRELPREPGRSTTRFTHLLSEPAGTAEPSPGRESSPDEATPGEGVAPPSLQRRVELLEDRVARLADLVAELQKSTNPVIDSSDEPEV